MTDDADHADAEQDTEEPPEIEDDELADFEAVADEIEDETTEEPEDPEAGPEESDPSDPDMGPVGDDSVSVGDIYCNALGMGAAVGRARYGSADADDRTELVEEYGDMARELELDKYVDQWMAENAGMDELGPGQAILMGTMMFGAMVAVDDPELMESAVEGASPA